MNFRITHSGLPKWLPLVLCSALPLTSAADYRSELTLAGQHDSEGGGASTDAYVGELRYYWDGVSTNELPLREAAFLNKSSSVAIGHSDVEVKTASNDKLKGDAQHIQTSVVLNDKIILGALYQQGDVENVDFDAYQIEAGLYLNDYTTLSFSASQLDIDLAADKLETYKLNLRTVAETYSGKSVGGQLSIGVDQTPTANTVLMVDGQVNYYFNNRFSVGGSFALSNPNSDDSRENIYGFMTEYFITENIAIAGQFAITVFEEKQIDTDEDNVESFSIILTGRL